MKKKEEALLREYRRMLHTLWRYKDMRVKCSKYKNNYYYMVFRKKDGIEVCDYLGDRGGIVDMICAFRYFKKSVTMLEKGASAADVDPNRLKYKLPAVYQKLPPFVYNFAGVVDIDEWRTRNRVFSNAYPETKRFATKAGWLVRSKSEVLIADLLTANEIPFVYEEVIDVNGHLIAADFKALYVKDYSEIIIEHFGNMDDPAYRERTAWKIHQYLEAGYIPGVDLIMLFESKSKPLTRQTLQRVFHLYFW